MHEDARKFRMGAVEGDPPLAQKRTGVHRAAAVAQSAYVIDPHAGPLVRQRRGSRDLRAPALATPGNVGTNKNRGRPAPHTGYIHASLYGYRG